jgi:hypothetical protein
MDEGALHAHLHLLQALQLPKVDDEVMLGGGSVLSCWEIIKSAVCYCCITLHQKQVTVQV